MKCDPLFTDKRPEECVPPARVMGDPGPEGATEGNMRRHSSLPGSLGNILLALIFGLIAAFPGASALPALGAEKPVAAAPQEPELTNGPLDYDRAARLAIRQSPYFTRTSLEINIKRMDETDSRYDMLPSVKFNSNYYVDKPNQAGVSSKAYVLRFVSEGYNPVASYLTLQAQKLITQIAILYHMQAISDGLQRLGRVFLEMDCLKQVAARQQDLIDLARQNLTYFQNRLSIGSVTILEVKVATQELEGVQKEMERLTFSQNRLRENLKTLLGLKAGQETNLSLKEARNQLVGKLDPDATNLERTRARSYDLKVLELKRQLQEYQIMMAKARMLPNFFFGAQTADPLSTIQTRELFFYVGVDVPVWDGFKRLRNISRQKTVMRQCGSEKDLKVVDLGDKWQEAQEKLHSATAARSTAQSFEELARLKERQSEIRYQSGGEPLAVYLEGRKGLLEAQKNTILKALDYDLAVLGLRHFSGDLGASYVDASSWQQ